MRGGWVLVFLQAKSAVEIRAEMLKRIAMMVPQVRRVREHIHRLDHLYRQALKEAGAAAQERDEARARVAELERALAEAQAAQAVTVDDGSAQLIEALHQELQQLEVAYRASVQLNNELMKQLPRPRLVA